MTALFCCSNIQPFRPQVLSHEPKFRDFKEWAAFPRSCSMEEGVGDGGIVTRNEPLYAVQLVRQVNYGALESKRYFIVVQGKDEPFLEVSEKDLIEANFKKLNSYKNFRCAEHDKFFEVNLYQKDPVNTHHWRANLARPATEIDL